MLHMIIASALATFPGWGLADAQTDSKENKSKNKYEHGHFGRTCNPTDWALQLRGAAFIPITSQLRKIYGTALPTMEVEGSYSLMKDKWTTCDQLLLWGNAGWTSKTGKSIGFGYYSKLNLVPLTLGLEYQINFARAFDFYFGIGPSFSMLRIKNNDGFQTSHFSRNEFGFTTKTGFRYTFCRHFFFDAFADYYYTRFRKMNHDPTQNISGHFSGFFIGGGFGGKW